MAETIPAPMLPSYIDVRDLALAHVRVLTEPTVNNKRFLIGGMPLTLIDMGGLSEEVGDKLVKESGEYQHTTVVSKIEAQEGNETVHDMAKRILEIKAKK